MSKQPFGFDRSDDSPGFLLWQTTMTWQRKIKKVLEPFDLSHTQFVLLANLLWFEIHKQSTTQAILVQSTKIEKMTVSKSLKKLQSMNLIQRFEYTDDTRAKSVKLTPLGQELISQVIPLIEKADQEYFSTISHYQLDSLLQIFRTLTSHTGE